MTSKGRFLVDLQSDITKVIESVSTPLLQKIDEQEHEIERLKAELDRLHSNPSSQMVSQSAIMDEDTARPYMDEKTLKKLQRFCGKFDEPVISSPDWSDDDAKLEYKHARDKLTPLKDKISIFKLLVQWNVLHKKYNKAKLIDWYTELLHQNKKTIYTKKEHRAFLTFILDEKFSHSPQLIRWYRKLKMENELKDLQCYFWKRSLLQNAPVSNKIIAPFFWLAISELDMKLVWNWDEMDKWLLEKRCGSLVSLQAHCMSLVKEYDFRTYSKVSHQIRESASVMRTIGYTVLAMDKQLEKTMKQIYYKR
jgi:hypothetical protein